MYTPRVRHTCLKLQLSNAENSIFVKGTWLSSHFILSITDGQQSWVCNASEEEVSQRASQWDQPVSEYIELGEQYLQFRQPGSVYGFADAGDGSKRLSWTFEKEGTKLKWQWKCLPSPNSKKTIAGILEFLMNADVMQSDDPFEAGLLDPKARGGKKLSALPNEVSRKDSKMSDVSEAVHAFVAVQNAKAERLKTSSCETNSTPADDSLSACMSILNFLPYPRVDFRVKALSMFKDPDWRKMFLEMSGELRVAWLMSLN